MKDSITTTVTVMALTVRLESFEIPKAKSRLVARVEFRGKCSSLIYKIDLLDWQVRGCLMLFVGVCNVTSELSGDNTFIPVGQVWKFVLSLLAERM